MKRIVCYFFRQPIFKVNRSLKSYVKIYFTQSKLETKIWLFYRFKEVEV